MSWFFCVGLLFFIFPCGNMLQCHFGHHLERGDDIREHVISTKKCVGEDMLCLRLEAVTLWYSRLEVPFEGAVCSNRSTCLNKEANCRLVLTEVIDGDNLLSDPLTVEFRNCTWACCDDNLCNDEKVATIRDQYKIEALRQFVTPKPLKQDPGGVACQLHARTLFIIAIVCLSTLFITLHS